MEMVTRCRPLKRPLCSNDSFTRVVVVVIALLLVQFVNIGHAKGASTDGESSAKLPQCAKVTCTQPPEGLKCDKTEIKNPAVLKKVGKMKDCCTAWRCKEEDGSFSTYFGMSGTESAVKKDDKKKDKKSKSAVTTTEKEDEADATTPKPKKSKGKKPAKNAATTEKLDEDNEESTTPKSKTTKKPKKKKQASTAVTVAPEDEKSPEDKCAEAKAKCPMPEGDDACTVTMSKESLNFKPKGELDSCCPIYNCTRPDGSYRLHYLMSGGAQPKKEAEIASEKGQGTDDKKCPNVQCATEPQAGSDGPICEKSTETESSRIKKLGPFRECCDIWKCVYPDTSFYTHFELQAPSFWLAETSFQSEPSTSTVVNAGIDEPTTTEETSTEKPGNVSGDEVAEPDEAADDKDGDAPAKKKKKKPKRPHKPQPSPNGNGRYAYSTYYNSSWSSGDNSGGNPVGPQDPNANNPSLPQQPQPPQMPFPMGPPPGTIPMGPPPGTIPMGPPPGTVPGMGYGPPMMMPPMMMYQGR